MSSINKATNDGVSTVTFDDLPDAAHVRLPVVATLYATSTSNVWRWVKLGLIPTPRKLGPQTTVWNVGDLRQALKAHF